MLAVPHGALTQTACFTAPVRQRCTKAVGLGSTQNLALSPDGKTLYATSNFTWGMDVFARTPHTGALKQVQCLSTRGLPGCTTVPGMAWAFWTTVSPDGRNVYVSGGQSDSIAVLRRSAATGRVTSLGCIHNTSGGDGRGAPTAAASGCALVSGLSSPRTIAFDPSGHDLYVANFGSNTITAFARDGATGALSTTAVRAKTRAGVTDLTVSRDGRSVYAVDFRAGAVEWFARDTASGALTPAGSLTGRGLNGAYAVTLSPDQRNVYVGARHSSAVTVYARDAASGALRFISCVAATTAEGCVKARGLHGVRGVAVSADGRNVYTGAFSDSAIAVFARGANGGLTQLRGKAGCAAALLSGCTRARGVRNAWAVLPTSNGLYTGVGGDGNSGLGVFTRAR